MHGVQPDPSPLSGVEAHDRCDVPEGYARVLVERARPIGPAERILDLGCGTGTVSRILRRRLGGAATIVGVDVSQTRIEEARALAPDVAFREGDAMALPFPDSSFDLVLCTELLQFVSDRVAALREARRVLAPGGRFLVSVWRTHPARPLDGPSLRLALKVAGYTDIRVESVSLDDAFRAATAANVATATVPPGARDAARDEEGSSRRKADHRRTT